jgi:c-di-GMP-binding flagellar brake protein YcgR
MIHLQSLDINIGTPMQIEFETVKHRLKTELVGMVQHSYLILKMPPIKTSSNTSKIFLQGTPAIVRFVHQGTAYGLSSKIASAIYKPSKLLFLNYPKKIESYKLRKGERVLCLLPAELQFSSTENKIQGSVVDISKAGCLYSAETKAFYNKQELPAKNDTLVVSLQLPGFKNTITIDSKVKNIDVTKNQIKMGLKFVSMSDDAYERLYDFLEGVGVA